MGGSRRAQPVGRTRVPIWAGYAACLWAAVFAAMSFYWALGGTLGLKTIGTFAQSRDPTFVALLWVTGAMKIGGGLVALALVRPWGHRVPRPLLLGCAWAGGIGLALYGSGNLLQHALMVIGMYSVPDAIGSMTAVWWHLLFWDPWWIGGGVLFSIAAWGYTTNTRN
ncbi:DUF3995 domain-containing protein [Natrialba aegyptia]|uniref:DUF3995 domain-containing protein n=1 Tax=Natrialba aegyptia DSM 13077 TaxID=1227491 RepID=M0BAJ0_9EURY|nr:DUF3995 domain-containing protein [Natrialba aegyptia]ELZ07482.1 hypothetical protein C480_05481 [Natrialba aegyptia DSM 13077]